MDQRIADMAREEIEARPTLEGEGELDQTTLQNIMMAGGNSEGLFTPEPEMDDDGEVKAVNEEIDEEAKMSTGRITNKFGDYVKVFQDDIVKNPDRYTIQTPEGQMSIKEALAQGYDPATRTFVQENASNNIEADLAGLAPEEAEVIRGMTNPGRANEAPPMPMPEGMPPEMGAAGQEGLPPEAGAAGPEGQALPPGILGALGGGQ